MGEVKKLIITAECIALCIVLPMAFHAVPNAGSVISPMHIPVLLCGLVCGWSYGLICGLLGPLLSGLLMQMPPMAYLPGMMIELGVYGFSSGVLMKSVHTGNFCADLYISLTASMLLGRIAAGLANAWIFSAGNYSIAIWATAYFAIGVPGIVIQLIIIPAVVAALEKAKLIPRRYGIAENKNKKENNHEKNVQLLSGRTTAKTSIYPAAGYCKTVLSGGIWRGTSSERY